jgi:hypothetical protein
LILAVELIVVFVLFALPVAHTAKHLRGFKAPGGHKSPALIVDARIGGGNKRLSGMQKKLSFLDSNFFYSLSIFEFLFSCHPQVGKLTGSA